MMESEEPKLGSSLLTESVKEIAKEVVTTVPERYFQSQIHPSISFNTHSLPHLPVIDLNKLLSEEVKGSELQNLHFACKEWGFFQVCSFIFSFPYHHS